MANRPHVPKFGEWDGMEGDETPYTIVFDDARKGRGGKGGAVNPYDPRENASSRSNQSALPREKPRAEEPRQQQQSPYRQQQGRFKSRDDLRDMRPQNPNPRIENRRPSGRTAVPIPEANKLPVRPTVGLRNQNSDGWRERMSSRERNNKPGLYDAYGSGRGVPTRPNLRTPDRVGKAPAVPRFGGWDGSPNVGYTDIFNQVREDRNDRGRVQNIVATPPRSVTPIQDRPPSPKGCCFLWKSK